MTLGLCRALKTATNHQPTKTMLENTDPTETLKGVGHQSLVRLTDILDAEESAFVEKVLMNSGAKIRDGAWSADGERPLWKRPEELKLISAVGSYSWIPTTRIVLGVEANVNLEY